MSAASFGPHRCSARPSRVTRPVARARLYASGLAYADLALNGQATSARQLEPGFTDYEKTVLYTTDDVTGAARGGPERALGRARVGPLRRCGAHVGLGLGRGGVAGDTARCGSISASPTRTAPRRSSRPTPRWKVSTDGPTRFDSYYLGETFDARRDLPRWRQAGFDDAAWAAARVVRGAGGRAARRDARADPHRAAARARHALRADARHRRLRHRPEPHRLGRTSSSRRRRARRSRSSTARSSTSDGTATDRRQRPGLRPAADRLLRGAGRRARRCGRPDSATRASSTCS